MKDNIPVLHCKLKRYERKSKQKSKDGKEQISRRYMIPVKKDQIEGTKFQDIEDIIIIGKEDFEFELQKSKVISLSHEKLKKSLNNKEKEIKELNEQIRENNLNDKDLEDLKLQLTKKFESKLESIINEYESEIIALSDKIENVNKIKSDYKSLYNHNKELERELKRLKDLRTLEKESFKIKLHEVELTIDEYEKLKKSHELLWDVVEEKDKKIKELENKGIVNNFFNKIRK